MTAPLVKVRVIISVLDETGSVGFLSAVVESYPGVVKSRMEAMLNRPHLSAYLPPLRISPKI